MNNCEELHGKEKMRLWTVIATLRGCLHASSLFHVSRNRLRGIIWTFLRSLAIVNMVKVVAWSISGNQTKGIVHSGNCRDIVHVGKSSQCWKLSLSSS